MKFVNNLAIGFASIVCSAAVLATAISPAFGAEQETNSQSISLRYLDLASSRDQAVLQQRIRRAAENVCGRPDIRDLGAQRDFEDCRAKAAAQAAASVRTLIAAADAHREFATKVDGETFKVVR